MSSKFSVVTTFNADGYQRYGQRMIQTFLANWPTEVTLVVYAEGCAVQESAVNLQVHDLHQSSAALVAFKQQWKNIPKANGDVSQDPVRRLRKDAGKGFKWNAVRFAHKVYAIFCAAQQVDSEWLLWMDADMVCHSPITIETLQQLCPAGRELCYLGRQGKYTECGLYAMNLHQPTVQKFLTRFQHYYDAAEQGIFKLEEWHDSFVFDAVRKTMPEIKELDWSGAYSKGEGHPLINSSWGAYLDHLKGSRKLAGRSNGKDLKIKRQENYWVAGSL